jgi:hypothetical protein
MWESFLLPFNLANQLKHMDENNINPVIIATVKPG